MSHRLRLIRWLAPLVFLVGTVQLACVLTARETVTPAPPSPEASPVVVATDTLKSPTSTPAGPTPTPMPPLPPQVVGRTPARGEEALVDAPLVIRFDQPMDQDSVEEAFAIEPTVKGEFEWADDRTVLFRPADRFERQTRYDVTVGESATSAAGLAAELPYSFRFQTVGFLEVSQTLPADGAEDLDVHTTITVMFNRPVVPLTHSSQPAPAAPLSFNPPINGEGEWLNTSIYVFRPDGPLAAGTLYQATVAAGLQDLTGGVLVSDYVWTFTTQAPQLTWYTPRDADTNIGLTESISMTFNQPMDPTSTEAAFHIESADGVVPAGRFVWNEDHTEMAWRPDDLLAMETVYVWTVSSRAQAALGGTSLKEAVTAGFSTVNYPALLFTEPADGNPQAEPYGGLELYFASPMDTSTVMPNLSIIPEPTGVYTWWDRWENRFYVGFDKEASTDYLVTVGADMADPYGHTLPEETVIRFTTRALDPMAYLNIPGRIGTYNAYTQTVVYATYLNVDQLDFTLARLTAQQTIELTGPGGWQKWDEYSPPEGDIVRRWTVPVESVLNETAIWRVRLADAGGNPLRPGLYYLEMTAPNLAEWQRSKHVLMISPLNLTIKTGADQVLVWATDLVSGQPAPGIPVTILGEEGASTAEGVTDGDGLLIVPYAAPEYGAIYAQAGAPGEATFSLGSSYWSEGISSWDFNLQYEDYGHQQLKSYLYTDRPIYRPGQTVYFKGVVREPDEARYRLASMEEVEVTVFDWSDTLIYQETLPLTEFGTFAGEVHLDEEARSGNYYLVVSAKELYGSIYFPVAEYRKPEFQVEVSPAVEQVVAGDTVQAGVKASYFFGGPVDGAEVSWAVFADDYAFRWDGPGRYSFADYEDWYWYWWDEGYTFGYGELVAEGSGVTDAQGQFTISLPAELGDETGAKLWTVEATVEDINHQRITGRAEVVVHPAAQYAGIYADRYVGTAGEEQPVNLIVVDLEGNPIPGAEATLVALQREWYNVQVEENGRTRWEWTVVETPVYTETATMDGTGRASVSFVPPEGGSYRLRALTADAAGRQNRASAFLWVSSSTYVSWRMENNDRIELVADRDSYQPGDVAEILIPSPFRGEATALVTVERGRFFQHEIITLRSNSEIYRLPITPDYAPTIFVSVVLIKGIDETSPLSSFKVGVVKLNVSTEQQALTVDLVPESDTYAPGETVVYDVRVTDYQGEPVEAELSLALVDLSVLTLAPDPAQPILDAFYSERGLGIQTGVGLVLNVDRLNEQLADLAKGGGGGAEAALGVGLDVRAEFPDTAYWEAFLKTDADGRAHVEIPLPDNLTTWRLAAKAITPDTRVGQASTDIVTTKPLLVRPLTPRFFVVNDRVQLGAVVHNNTGDALEVEVVLAAQGVSLDAGVSGAQTVDIPAGGRVQVDWNVTVGEVPYVGLVFTASGGGLVDATRPTLATGPDGTIPVLRYSAPDVVGTAGQLVEAGSRTEGILLPPGVDTTQGTLQVALAPSLAAAMQDGLDYLEHFEYECTEQTVSRFLPNVLTYRALQELNLTDPALESKLEDLVSQGLQRLYNQQHYDGGWGWWYTGESNTQVTAWVLLGLDKAEEAGFLVDQEVVEDAQDYLSSRWSPPRLLDYSWEANRQAFILYVLAERGEAAISTLENLFEEKDLLSHYGKAYLALAYGLLEGAESERIDSLLGDLSGEAILSATGAHWEEAEYDWWNWNTDTRSTAIILDLLARYAPENELAPNAVRWLMVARRGGHWETTQETAWALIALTDWMVATGELEADYDFDAAFNGRLVTEGHAGRDTIRETTELQIAVADMLLDQVNQLAIGRSDGPGRLYYTAHLETYLPVEALEPIGRGLMVAREYTAASCEPEEETCERLSSIPVGEAVRVKLTIVAPHDLYYVLVEDPLPAGAEAVDQTLLTSSSLDTGEGLERTDLEYRWGYWGWWWFSQTQVRDEKVVLFADYLPAGTYEYTYIMRASLPGEYRVMPTTAREFYFPEVFGRSDGMLFEIQP
jgi:uncharacterized protein YfaS (alpha-2-macroglobulin family)